MKLSFLLILSLFIACTNTTNNQTTPILTNSIIILGTAQDAGSPHINCRKECCLELWSSPDKKTNVVSLAIYDSELKQNWLFEATPDLPIQLNKLKEITGDENLLPNGIFLTHAHIGHYSGLQFFGKEAMGANGIPVYALPRMKNYLENNGPWSQVVQLNNIELNKLNTDSTISLSKNLKIKPVLVPHRDEYSETAAYYIYFKQKRILFIPDIDKWDKWDKNIIEEIKKVDIAFLDATFYDNNELPNRDMSEIPHPFVVESMKIFEGLSHDEKSKVYFIHFNHSNPLLKEKSKQSATVSNNGFNIAKQYDIISLN